MQLTSYKLQIKYKHETLDARFRGVLCGKVIVPGFCAKRETFKYLQGMQRRVLVTQHTGLKDPRTSESLVRHATSQDNTVSLGSQV